MHVRRIFVDGIPLGTTLMRKRKESGLSLEDLSRKTRIRIEFLHNIEKGHNDRLPCLPYNRGFIRAYASEVGVDPNFAAERFNFEMGIEN